jgi:predicted unusual protein kinase regulating ubiquinone biosynthesis (AarF/ABC1/UbiB family)
MAAVLSAARAVRRSLSRRPRVTRRRAALGGGAVAAAGAGVATATLAQPDRRERVRRALRVWRLTARRGASWVVLKVRGAAADQEERERLERSFAIRSAEDVARELGAMKGAIMKVGQMVSFIADGLPPEARAALESLQADVPPMAPSLAASVVRDDLGDDPERVFLDWDPVPVAAASIGQVHKAVLRDGRLVAVKVQYPGVDRAIKGDLDNAEWLYSLFAAVALPSLDVRSLVDELRARMTDELDYHLEAERQTAFADRYRGHPFIAVPDVVPDVSGRRVLTSEWVEGQRMAEFLDTASAEAKHRAGEVVFRFAQGSVFHHRVFNGDPHPGNYFFAPDGSVTFLDFGLVKRWTKEEWESLTPVLDPLLAEDAPGTVAALIRAGFLRPDHGQPADRIFEYVSSPYVPYLSDEFTFTRAWTSETLAKLLDIRGPYGPVMAVLDMPASFVILDRVVWGVSALLGRLEARGPWRGILDEYRTGAPPVTALGEAERDWAARGRAAS